MARKAIGKTSERALRAEFNKKNPLPKKLEFLDGVKFTSIAYVTLPDKVKESTLIEFTPKQVQELLVRREVRYGGALRFLNDRKVKVKPAPVGEALKRAGEVIESLQQANAEAATRMEELSAELSKQKRRVLSKDRELGEAHIQLASANATCERFESQIRSYKAQIEELLGRSTSPGGRSPADAWEEHQPGGWLHKTNLGRPK
ncbi:hypothetical protein PS918_02403 [Pseudomonas fluorescens]|uniref:Uncharacterized protein n=1 Tax=Pseudomonas fluorescens TaxID=294 RepID=A0A5E7S765_PSEFL|nr:hypothetical protein [Pseudomonas fluorescens]VVP82149.1 hypothetical protein PS918_02403 [Pseudomonas fluorescens]